MRELKWIYDRRRKEWWVDPSVPNNYFIKKRCDGKEHYFLLKPTVGGQIGSFAKLKNAKEAARLLTFG